jgi:1-acyl-sn-glycerol-3-phosphate acyltransferase
MNLLKYFFWFFYKLWFYIICAVPWIIMFPLLFIFSLKESGYRKVFFLASVWSEIVLFFMGFYWKIDKIPDLKKGENYMFISNHTSMVDIMLMLSIFKKHPFVFVGKVELSRIPFFGVVYKRACILVDRSSSESRKSVFYNTQKKLSDGLSICIYPEAGVPEPSVELDKFKNGAFKIAIEHQIPIVCLTFLDNKKRFPFAFFSGKPGLLRIKYHDPFETKGLLISDVKQISDNFREIILSDLSS